MSSLKEILIDPKLFRQNFIYNENFLLEEVNVKDVAGKSIPSIACIPLRYRKDRLFIDKVRGVNKKVYLPREEFNKHRDGDWLITVATNDKNPDGITLRELEVVTNLLKCKDMKQLKKVLETKGIPITFTPCHKCGSLEDLTMVDGEITCDSCRAER